MRRVRANGANIYKYKGREGEFRADYLEKLKKLTAESWRKSFE